MVMLTDLLDRKRALEAEDARIQRDLRILRQIDELAQQLDEPHCPAPPEPDPEQVVHRIRVGTTPEDLIRERLRTPTSTAAAPAPPETEPAAPPAPPPPPRPPAPPGTAEPEAKRSRVSSGQRKRLLQAMHDLRGTALQIDLLRKSGLSSPTVSVLCRELEAEGVFKNVGKGGYANKSIRWQLVSSEPAPTQRPLTPRVRRAIETDEKKAKRGAHQSPTHEGRILSVLSISPGMTVPELAAEVGIPASTVGRLVGKLKGEGEVVDADDRGHYRRVMS